MKYIMMPAAFNPQCITAQDIGLALCHLSEVPNLPQAKRFDAIISLVDPLIFAWNYERRPNFFDHAAHFFRYVDITVPMEDTTCPPSLCHRDEISEILGKWNYRERWILASFIYLGASTPSPMCFDYQRAIDSFSDRILGDEIVTWLAREILVHDKDYRVELASLSLILNGALDRNPLFLGYATCCVLSMARENARVSSMARASLDALIPNFSHSGLERLRDSLKRMSAESEEQGNVGVSAACYYALRRVEVRLGIDGEGPSSIYR